MRLVDLDVSLFSSARASANGSSRIGTARYRVYRRLRSHSSELEVMKRLHQLRRESLPRRRHLRVELKYHILYPRRGGDGEPVHGVRRRGDRGHRRLAGMAVNRSTMWTDRSRPGQCSGFPGRFGTCSNAGSLRSSEPFRPTAVSTSLLSSPNTTVDTCSIRQGVRNVSDNPNVRIMTNTHSLAPGET